MSTSDSPRLPTPSLPSQTRMDMRRVLVAWLFGAGWLALVAGAPLIRFAEHMGLKRYDFTWGLLGAVPFIGALAQWPGSYLVERFQRRKLVFFIGAMTQRLTWMAVGLLPLLIVPGRWGAILSVLALVLLDSASGSITAPGWTSWMAEVIPARLRGRYFGLRTSLGLLVIIPVSLSAGWLLDGARTGQLTLPWPATLDPLTLRRAAFGLSVPTLCSIFFLVGSVLGSLDILMFARVPDRPTRARLASVGLREIFGPPLADRAFMRFIAFYALLWLGIPGIGYYIWRYAMQTLKVSDAWLQVMFVVAPAVGTLLFASLWGRLIDRFGRKTVWIIAAAFPAVLPACWIAVGPSVWPLGVALGLLGGLTWSGVELANFNAMLHFAGGERGSSGYPATFALSFALAGILSGLLFGGLAELSAHLNRALLGGEAPLYWLLFAVASLIRVAAYVLLLPRVGDEGREPVRVAVRYIFTDIYNTLYAARNWPLRRADAPAPPASYDPHRNAANK